MNVKRPDDDLAARKLASANILLAEDSPFMSDLIGAMLEAFGVTRVQRTGDGQEALHLMENSPEPIDLVIADWQMEPMSGMAFLKHVRQELQGRARRMPIIICTAHTDLERVIALRDAGANEVLTKPVSPASVYERLTRALIRPRPFVAEDAYTGPCRRRRRKETGFADRRAKNRAAPVDSDTTYI